MQTVTGIEAHQWKKNTAVTLGKFDGLHRGHQKLVEKITDYSGPECESVLCAFDMGRDSLMTKSERRSRLDGRIDYLVEYPFTKQVREMAAEDFIDHILCRKLRASHIVVGTDFSFGYQKKGDVSMLADFAQSRGYSLDVIEKERYGGRIISSSYIKESLADGRIELANKLLGYPYEVSGTVEHGKRLGRTLGFPTMNIEPEKRKILPRFGVYACRVRINGQWYNAVGNAGIKPTVTREQKRLVEVYVYGYRGDAYGEYITVQFCGFERPETKFESVEKLKEQVMKDLRYGEEFFSQNTIL